MEISLDNPIHLFNNHLSKADNKYVVLSAPFGYGKTYFLRDYFKRNTDKYNAFWLSPVKYVVGQNEDIFEYIKIDIAIHLLAAPELDSENKPDFSEDLYVHQFLRKNSYEVAKLLLQIMESLEVSGIGIASSFIAKTNELKKSYETWKDSFKQETRNTIDEIIQYTSKQDKVKGSIFEDDSITQVIRLALETIKSKNCISEEQNLYKQNVLIIDDFDRLDPEHIFRILNILSVHRDYHTGDDKFGFDKIIIVCSIENIRNIYIHKYGSEVDFDGYIEKFYSSDIFNFNNQAAVSYHLGNLFADNFENDVIKILGFYLSSLVEKKVISIRSALKYNRFYNLQNFKIGEFEIPIPVIGAYKSMHLGVRSASLQVEN